jgi:hypothetical protein
MECMKGKEMFKNVRVRGRKSRPRQARNQGLALALESRNGLTTKTNLILFYNNGNNNHAELLQEKSHSTHWKRGPETATQKWTVSSHKLVNRRTCTRQCNIRTPKPTVYCGIPFALTMIQPLIDCAKQLFCRGNPVRNGLAVFWRVLVNRHSWWWWWWWWW